MNQLPIKLEQDTILEALFEIRFQPSSAGVAELLPGYFNQSLDGLVDQVDRLPGADIPKQVLDQDPNLRYKPSHRLRGEDYSVSTGEYVANISNQKPYVGWKTFEEKIGVFLDVLEQFSIIDTIERISLRYSNIIPVLTDVAPLDAIQCNIGLGEFDLRKHPFNLRTEIQDSGCINAVQVAPNAEVKNQLTEEVISGTWLDIDTMYNFDSPETSLDRSLVTHVHNAEKSVFFRILTAEAQERLGAQYE